MTTTRDTTTAVLDSAADVLGFARSRRAVADRAEADVVMAAVVWAEQHPAESIHDAATWSPGGEVGVGLAGPGAPLVAEFCVAELAVALGMSTDSGRALIAHAVELKYRLPRVWARVQAHGLVAWKARRIAAATLGLSLEAAGFLDAQVAGFAHRIGPAQLDRLVAEAVARFMPAQAAEAAQAAADGRHFTIHHDQVSFTGTSFIEGELDLADAIDLDAALTRGAAGLKAAGSAGVPRGAPGHRRRRPRPPPARPRTRRHRRRHSSRRRGPEPEVVEQRAVSRDHTPHPWHPSHPSHPSHPGHPSHQASPGGPLRAPLRSRDHRHRHRF